MAPWMACSQQHCILPFLCPALHLLQKHGMKSASKRQRARAAAEDEADEMLALKDRLASMHEEVGVPGVHGWWHWKVDGWVAG